MNHIDVYRSLADAAYQGAPGAYSEEAALQLLGRDAHLVPCATLEQAVEAITDGRVGHAVVPIENAVSGTVSQVYELLLTHDLVVTGETSINIDYVLIAPHGTSRAAITRVMSHPLALAQCGDFLRSNRGIEAVSVFDTAGAVRMAIEANDGRSAAIASRRAAEIYGADIIAEHIQDHRENWTRFLLVSEKAHAQSIEGAQKALVAFGLRHEPGALVRALQPIADAGLSITKIEGRPIAAQPFEYHFVVEMAAPAGQTIDAAAVNRVREATTWFRVLGAFRL
jgi:prephenate dehydratase